MNTHIVSALTTGASSNRLRAALSAGTHPDPSLAEHLIARCAVEPDFYVRDMLTWALCRLPAEITVPLLLAELSSPVAQARSQALHTLSKIGDPAAWPAVAALVHDADDEVARSAWRAAVALVPEGSETTLAEALAAELGRGDREVQLSLSRALVELGDAAQGAVDAAAASPDPLVRAHAEATRALQADPDSGFALEFAKRVSVDGVPC